MLQNYGDLGFRNIDDLKCRLRSVYRCLELLVFEKNHNITSRKMAGATRLELATSGVTGQHCNQLNYAPA